MKRKLKANEISIIKLNQEELLDIIRENIFHNYNEYGKILNKDIITGIDFIKGEDGSYFVYANFHRLKLEETEGEFINSNTIERLDNLINLSRTPIILLLDKIKELLK